TTSTFSMMAAVHRRWMPQEPEATILKVVRKHCADQDLVLHDQNGQFPFVGSAKSRIPCRITRPARGDLRWSERVPICRAYGNLLCAIVIGLTQDSSAVRTIF